MERIRSSAVATKELSFFRKKTNSSIAISMPRSRAPSHHKTNSFRPGPATDYYGSFKVERTPIEAPICDADIEETAQQLINDAAKLGIKVRVIAQGRGVDRSLLLFRLPPTRKLGNGHGWWSSLRVCDLK